MIIKKNLIEILVALATTILLLYSSEAIIYPDSIRYISQNVIDPPLYSTIIKIMKSLFHTLNSVVIFQTILIGIGIIHFVKTLSNHFSLNILLKIIILVSLFLPILKFYRFILTEPIGYALSLLFVSFTIKLIYNFSIKYLILNTIIIVALLLTRHQFIIIYLVVLILYTGIAIICKSKKTFTFLLASFLSIIILNYSLNNLNIYLKRNDPENNSYTYKKLGPYHYTFFDAIYISSSKDVRLFENKDLKKVLTYIFDEMDKRKALSKYYNSRGHFALSLNEISDYSSDLIEILAREQQTEIASLKKEISIKLIKKNFDKYVKHIFKKFYDSTWLFIFLLFLILLSGSISFLKYKSRLSLLVIFISSFSFFNHSLVYMFGRVQPRYLIYSDFILLIFIFLLFSIFLNKQEKK